MKVPCDKCEGTGVLEVEDLTCGATVKVGRGGFETVECWADRSHRGEPHMAILCDPCPECGGMDECDQACETHETRSGTDRITQHWYAWDDDDLGEGVVVVDDDVAAAWKARFR